MKPNERTVSDKKPRSKKQLSPASKFILTVTKILIIFFVALACAIVGIVGGAVYGYIKTAPVLTEEQLKPNKFTSFVYDSKEGVIAELKGDENRVWVDDKEIPKHLKDAFVAIEDERFYEHPGVDFKRLAGAVINLFNPGSHKYGASTITQQVVRNLTGEKQVTLQRKVQEQWRALQLEKKLEKWQILELYMNLIYMGENCYGVQSAAKTYFNKDVSLLTIAQSASLAGITNWPAKYTPLTTEGRKHNKERQELILGKMLELGRIDQKEYDAAMKEDLQFASGDKTALSTTSKQSYFVDKVVSDVKKDLMSQLGMSEQLALRTIYNNGLQIFSTMDPDMQKEMDSVFKDEKFFPVINKKLEHPQGAMVIIDPKTGQVKALYGGYGEKKGNTWNRATQNERQPGSTFKPIAVYAPALNEKVITAAKVYDDVPVHLLGDSKPRYPKNYDPSYGGLTAIRDALRKSINVVAASVWTEMERNNPGISLQYLKKAGINRDNERYVSISMGGLNKGVNPLEMAAAYVPFANKGLYFQPATYTKVLDKEGNVILEKKPTSTIVYEETTAFIMANMMKDVCTQGTAAAVMSKFAAKMPIAGKTGTTSDNKDKWFVGYSPYYVGASWYGYDKPSTLQSTEYNQAQIIWREVMERVHKNLKPVDFAEPAGLVKKTVCIYSGKTPTDLCSKDPRGNSIRTEYFIKGTEPKDDDVCTVHVSGTVCKDSKDTQGRNLLFGPSCPVSSQLEKVFIKRPVPFKPISPDDPYPGDAVYEEPEGEYCNIHGPGGTGSLLNLDPDANLNNAPIP
ncbi:MAG: PBP1A family penicillin-binding protein [Clostridia bacterium]|nr:PBP1A family penicillin-binding protein [Clostridia bacterium]